MELSIVIPVYNEEKVIPIFYERINSLIPQIKKQFTGSINNEEVGIEIIFVNDGSTDNTLPILESFVVKSKHYRYISFSRNFGHQSAVSCGLRNARGKLIVVMDADLQDPPELIPDLIKKCKAGYDVVYAVRKRKEGGAFKNLSCKLYYILNSLISDQIIQRDSGDFSLMVRKVVDVINMFPEKELYIRGLRAWVGFKQTGLEYDRFDRKFGKTKYSVISLIKLAFRGIISTSTKPLFISGLFSIVSVFMVIGLVIFVLYSKMFSQSNLIPPGWTSIMVTVLVLSGFQLLSLWMLSLYLSKIYHEVLGRPNYIIEKDSLKNQ